VTSRSDIDVSGFQLIDSCSVSAVTVRYLTKRYIGEYSSNSGEYRFVPFPSAAALKPLLSSDTNLLL
jgi:hypothetical protein